MAVPTITTPRLVLRSVVPEDRHALVALLSDTDAMEHMHVKDWSLNQCHEWFEKALANSHLDQPEDLLWVVHRQDSGEVIGWFGMGNSLNPAEDLDISFGYALARPHWNHGYMTEIMLGIFAFAFETLGLPQLNANCRAENIGSARVMEKAGMRRTHSDYGADFEGNWSRRHHYLITQEDWSD